MIEKPDIEDGTIIMALSAHYSIQASRLEFLPIGNDPSGFAYRVEAKNGSLYFLKIKKNFSNFAGLFVPRFLKDHGVDQVVAPVSTDTEQLWTTMDEFTLILYPFILGNEAMRVGMTDMQWREFGTVLKCIHATRLDGSTSQYVKQETFVPKWASFAKTLHKQVNALDFDDPYQNKLAHFWKKHNTTIQTIIERAEMLGKRLQQADLEFVLCHADIHTANILITEEQDMFIVDWDDTLFAPKERDLMFVLGEDDNPSPEEQLFFEGYGRVEIDSLALAYYRYEWCVQEIGDFGDRVFFSQDAGESTKQNAVDEFVKLFSAGDVIEGALNTSMEV